MANKYLIETVGAKKRIRALRDFTVQGRQVWAGDTGGYVFDENTLSQDGACWIFSGDLGYPGITVSGDSIVDFGVNEGYGGVSRFCERIQIDGASAIIGRVLFSNVQFPQTGLGNVTVGGYLAPSPIGKFWKDAIGAGTSQCFSSPLYYGYTGEVLITSTAHVTQAYYLDANLIVREVSSSVAGAAGAILTLSARYPYMLVTVRKTDGSAVTVSEFTTAGVSLSNTASPGKLLIRDSRLEFDYSAVPEKTQAVNVIPSNRLQSDGDFYRIVNSNVKFLVAGIQPTFLSVMMDTVNIQYTNSATTATHIIGTFKNIKNLFYKGLVGVPVTSYRTLCVQGEECNTLNISNATLPDLGAAVSDPTKAFKFIRCNMPNGLFYDDLVRKNTYEGIDFGKAVDDLGKTTSNTSITVSSSDKEGFYALRSATSKGFFGYVESVNSVKNWDPGRGAKKERGLIIRSDAEIHGVLTITEELNCEIGGSYNAGEYDEYNLIEYIEQGGVTYAAGKTYAEMKGSTANAVRSKGLFPMRTEKGFELVNLPAGINVGAYFFDSLERGTGTVSTTNYPFTIPSTQLKYPYMAIAFVRIPSSKITPEDLKDVKIRIFKGVKVAQISQPLTLKGDVNLKDNVYLSDTTVYGSLVMSDNARMSNANVQGAALLTDNAQYTPDVTDAPTVTPLLYNLEMRHNARVLKRRNLADLGVSDLRMFDNSEYSNISGSMTGTIVMRRNSNISSGVIVKGVLELSDNAVVSSGTLATSGVWKLCGNYKNAGNVTTISGNGVASSVTDLTTPQNLRTKYDFLCDSTN